MIYLLLLLIRFLSFLSDFSFSKLGTGFPVIKSWETVHSQQLTELLTRDSPLTVEESVSFVKALAFLKPDLAEDSSLSVTITITLENLQAIADTLSSIPEHSFKFIKKAELSTLKRSVGFTFRNNSKLTSKDKRGLVTLSKFVRIKANQIRVPIPSAVYDSIDQVQELSIDKNYSEQELAALLKDHAEKIQSIYVQDDEDIRILSAIQKTKDTATTRNEAFPQIHLHLTKESSDLCSTLTSEKKNFIDKVVDVVESVTISNNSQLGNTACFELYSSLFSKAASVIVATVTDSSRRLVEALLGKATKLQSLFIVKSKISLSRVNSQELKWLYLDGDESVESLSSLHENIRIETLFMSASRGIGISGIPSVAKNTVKSIHLSSTDSIDLTGHQNFRALRLLDVKAPIVREEGRYGENVTVTIKRV
jgi:hypothetical protein